MLPTIQTKAVTYTVRDLLHTLHGETGAGSETPFTGRRVHFVGIGGTGMSGLAQMLMDLGAEVSGTDRAASAVTRRLAEAGAAVSYSEGAGALPEGVEMVVHSAAIKAEHPELVAARERNAGIANAGPGIAIPGLGGDGAVRGCEILKYAQMLGRVMKLKHGIAIAGTHGKSTTTAMTAHILLCAGKDPSFVVGATSAQLGGSSHSGGGDFFVVEACEYDRSFHQLRPKLGVVLNIEEDHLDYYSGIEEITESFATFLNQVDPGGVAIISASDENCATAARNAEATVETYGIDIPADWQAAGVRRFQGKAHFNVTYKGRKIGRLALSIAGRHNVGNALVAAAIATHCGVAWDQIQAAVESFRGADRRSQLLGQFPWSKGAEHGTPTNEEDKHEGHEETRRPTKTEENGGEIALVGKQRVVRMYQGVW